MRYLNLDISGNRNITASGWDELCKAEFDSTSLNSAADSNHTCSIYGKSKFNSPQYYEAFEYDVAFEPKAVRQKKIYSVLSSRHRECSNVQHLDHVPLEFLPDMLSSIQQYSDYHVGDKAPRKDMMDVTALSLIYEILRRWDKAISVYESLSR